jgi:hypothetical protein
VTYQHKKHLFKPYGPDWDRSSSPIWAESDLQKRLAYYAWHLGFKPKRYIDVPTPLGFRTLARGHAVYGPVTITKQLTGNYRNHEQEIVWFFWNLDSRCKGFWALMDNGRLLFQKQTLQTVLMFSDRNDALMAKLGGFNQVLK